MPRFNYRWQGKLINSKILILMRNNIKETACNLKIILMEYRVRKKLKNLYISFVSTVSSNEMMPVKRR